MPATQPLARELTWQGHVIVVGDIINHALEQSFIRRVASVKAKFPHMLVCLPSELIRRTPERLDFHSPSDPRFVNPLGGMPERPQRLHGRAKADQSARSGAQVVHQPAATAPDNLHGLVRFIDAVAWEETQGDV